MFSEDIVSGEDFLAEAQRLRDEDFKLKDAFKLFEGLKDIVQDASALHLLYQRPSGDIYVKVDDVPGTLSGNILRLQASLPWSSLSSHSAIRGDEISPIPLRDFDEIDDSEEDTSDLVAQLPFIAFDERIHFAKRSKCRSEIPNLLKAKGLPHIVELIGRTDDGEIVFPKLNNGMRLLLVNPGIVAARRILLQLAEAVISLHSAGIIHRDLALRNILASSDCQTAYLCDLEGCWGSEDCPEIADASRLDVSLLSTVPYSEKSDVYMFGRLTTDLILLNSPQTRWQARPDGNWLPPAPFRSIVVACLAAKPTARPNMRQVKAMLEAISAPDSK
ncbi:kinase-like domain-containing protein [Mycena latifolia]|nr:kinase-like domain-containing protein [Mycena latifolia]